MLYKIETTDEFVIDQFLRRFVKVDISPDDIFYKQLSSYTSSYNLSLTNIHPSIFSIIIAVCGGICLRSEDKML